MIVGVAALTLLAFRFADDEVTGRANVADAFGFTLIFVGLGYFLGWLPRVWERSKASTIEPLVTPAFVAMVLAYAYLGFRTYFVQPGPTGMSMLAQVVVMACLACRSEE